MNKEPQIQEDPVTALELVEPGNGVIIYRDFYERNLKIPFLAPECYTRLWNLVDPSDGVLLLGRYLESAQKLYKEDRIKPIRKFLESEHAFERFKQNYMRFAETVCPVVNKYGLWEDLEVAGLYVNFQDAPEGKIMSLGIHLPGKDGEFSVQLPKAIPA